MYCEVLPRGVPEGSTVSTLGSRQQQGQSTLPSFVGMEKYKGKEHGFTKFTIPWPPFSAPSLTCMLKDRPSRQQSRQQQLDSSRAYMISC